MGRAAGGVAGMKLAKGDHIVSAEVIRADAEKDSEILIIMEKGFGKMTRVSEYKVQGRAGSGIRTAKVTEKTGKIIGAQIITDVDKDGGELIVMSKKGQVIKTSLKSIPSLSRDTQGVTIMKLHAGDSIASVVSF